MMHYVNLMSQTARNRESRRDCLRLWSRVTVASVVLATPFMLHAYYEVRQHKAAVAALEMRYDPIRQLIAETKRLRTQIEQTQQLGRLPLALSRKTSVPTFLGLVGQTVSKLGGNVFLQQLTYEDSPDPFSNRLGATKIALAGLSVDRKATSVLVASLRRALPFADFETADASSTPINGQTRDSFSVRGSFPKAADEQQAAADLTS